MKQEQISTFGLTSDEFQLVTNSVWNSTIEVFREVTPIDAIMRRRIFALIMNLEKCTPVDRDFLQGCYEERIWFPEVLIFVGSYKPEWNVTGQLLQYKDWNELSSNLEGILQAAYSKTRNTENFREGLVRSFQIAREIKNRPGVTTANLSKDLSLPENLVEWYIQLLESAFEPIEFNEEMGGWSYYFDRWDGSMEQTIRSVLSDQAMRNELDGWISYEDNSIEMVEQIKSEFNKS